MLTGWKWTQDTIQTDIQPVLYALITNGVSFLQTTQGA
jgi:hypothetical protein